MERAPGDTLPDVVAGPVAVVEEGLAFADVGEGYLDHLLLLGLWVFAGGQEGGRLQVHQVAQVFAAPGLDPEEQAAKDGDRSHRKPRIAFFSLIRWSIPLVAWIRLRR